MLIPILYFFGILRPLLSFLIYTINLGETKFAEWTLIFTFRPFVDTTKTELMATAIDRSKIIRFYITHADTTIVNSSSCFCWCRLFVVIAA
jgi:hypothetical protein